MAKLRLRGKSFQADYFNKQGKRVRHLHQTKADAIAELDKTGKPWSDETNLQPKPGEDSEKLIPLMTKLPARLLYELKVAAVIRRSSMQAIIRKGVEHELSKGPRLPFDK